MKRKGIWTIVSMLVVLGLLMGGFGCQASQAPAPAPASPAPKASPRLLTVGTSETVSIQYVRHVAEGTVIDEGVPEVALTFVVSSGTTEGLRRMGLGEVDIQASADMETVYQAYTATGMYAGKPPATDLRIMHISVPYFWVMITAKKANIKSIYDLNGKRVAPGVKGSGTDNKFFLLQSIYGIKPELYYGTMADQADAFRNGRVDAWFMTLSEMKADPLILDVARVAPLELLRFTQEEIDKAKAAYPYFSSIKLAAGFYGDKEGLTFANYLITVVKKDLDADLVYKMVKALEAGKAKIVAAYKPWSQFEPSFTVDKASIPIHAGTVKWLKEKGLTIPASIIPPEAK